MEIYVPNNNLYARVHSSILFFFIIIKSGDNPNIHQLMDKQNVVYLY